MAIFIQAYENKTVHVKKGLNGSITEVEAFVCQRRKCLKINPVTKWISTPDTHIDMNNLWVLRICCNEYRQLWHGNHNE